MKSINIYSLGDPGTFVPLSSGDPTYYTERLSYEVSKMLYDASTAGMELRQEESSDYSTMISDFDTYASDFVTWIDGAVTASNSGLPVPAPPALPTLPGGPLAGLLLGILVRLAINLLIKWLEKKLDPDTDAQEIAAILKKALIDEDASGDEYSLLHLLSQVPLEVIINQTGGLENVAFNSNPST